MNIVMYPPCFCISFTGLKWRCMLIVLPIQFLYSFYGYFEADGGKGFHGCSPFFRQGRRYATHALKGPVKCRWGRIPVFHTDIDNFFSSGLQINSRQRHAPPADIFGKRDPCYIDKHSLKVVRGAARDARKLVIAYFFARCSSI